MPLVYILARAPWGPVSLRMADSTAELLARGEQPAHVVDVDDRDPAEVMHEALRLLPRADASGWIAERVDKSSKIVAQALSRVQAAMVVAEAREIAVLSPPALIAEHVEGGEEGLASEVCQQHAPARKMPPAPMTTNDGMPARARRRHCQGQEVDAKAIRAGLGMSQPEFSRAYGIPLATLRDWEQGRRTPDGAGRSLLLIVERYPVRARKVLEEYGDAVVA